MPPKRKKTLQTLQLPGIAIETQDPSVIKKHIAGVIALSFATKLCIVVLTVWVFSSFVDFFDISLYYGYASQILAGKIPFLDFTIEYPVLFLVPVLLPLVITLGTANPMLYILGFIGIMAVLDALIAACVYLAALRLFTEKTAYLCGILSATAFSAGYFAITKYDAFPTFLLIAGILFVLYGAAGKGYAAIALGFLAKIFPLLALPPALFHASVVSSVREEILRAAKVCLPLVILLAVPTLLLDPAAYKTYLFAAGAGAGLYVNTPTNTIALFLQDVLHLSISTDAISIGMYILMVAGFAMLIALAITARRGEGRRLLVIVLLLLFTAVFFSRFHSPQYILWLTPFLAILLAGSVRGILIFYLVQAMVYVEFPLMFGKLYVNLSYVAAPLTAGWYAAFLLFAVKWVVVGIAVYYAARSDGDLPDDLRQLPSRLRSLIGTTRAHPA
ncbi:MAG: hypothetical protein LUQ13_00525 [Methanomicrobiales archaeon]|nr:hypothetical protein [Methanomicrobiales archaeon]